MRDDDTVAVRKNSYWVPRFEIESVNSVNKSMMSPKVFFSSCALKKVQTFLNN